MGPFGGVGEGFVEVPAFLDSGLDDDRREVFDVFLPLLAELLCLREALEARCLG